MLGSSALYGFVLFGRRDVGYDLSSCRASSWPRVLAFALVFTPLDGIPLVLAATLVYWVVLFVLRGIPREVIDALLRRATPPPP